MSADRVEREKLVEAAKEKWRHTCHRNYPLGPCPEREDDPRKWCANCLLAALAAAASHEEREGEDYVKLVEDDPVVRAFGRICDAAYVGCAEPDGGVPARHEEDVSLVLTRLRSHTEREPDEEIRVALSVLNSYDMYEEAEKLESRIGPPVQPEEEKDEQR